jgi:hypothetical protein
MKIKFGHFNLVYPDPDKVSIEFMPETEFEKQFLDGFASLASNDKWKLHFVYSGALSLTIEKRDES